VHTKVPNFGYQLQFKSGKLENEIVTKEQIQQFLISLYGGLTNDVQAHGEVGFDVSHGIHLDKIGKLKPSRLLNEAVCCSLLNLELFLLIVQQADDTP
jgi:hypothetical protein